MNHIAPEKWVFRASGFLNHDVVYRVSHIAIVPTPWTEPVSKQELEARFLIGFEYVNASEERVSKVAK